MVSNSELYEAQLSAQAALLAKIEEMTGTANTYERVRTMAEAFALTTGTLHAVSTEAGK